MHVTMSMNLSCLVQVYMKIRYRTACFCGKARRHRQGRIGARLAHQSKRASGSRAWYTSRLLPREAGKESGLETLEAGSWSGSLALPAGSPVPKGDEGEGRIKTDHVVIKRTVLYNSDYEACG